MPLEPARCGDAPRACRNGPSESAKSVRAGSPRADTLIFARRYGELAIQPTYVELEWGLQNAFLPAEHRIRVQEGQAIKICRLERAGLEDSCHAAPHKSHIPYRRARDDRRYQPLGRLARVGGLRIQLVLHRNPLPTHGQDSVPQRKSCGLCPQFCRYREAASRLSNMSNFEPAAPHGV
jgi:hypothetical protein